MSSPIARAATSTSLKVVAVLATFAGLTSTAIRVAEGTSSRRRSNRFATSSPLKILIPVILPPGRARLATRPSRTGSSETILLLGRWALKLIENQFAMLFECAEAFFGRKEHRLRHL